MDTLELVKALPKAEQHIHIVGSTRPETLLWLVEESGVDAPFETLEDVERFFRFRDFPHFLEVYSACMDYITDEGQFDRIVYEMLEGESSCNVHYVEAIFAVPNRVRRGLDYSLMLDAVNRGTYRAWRDFGVECSIRIDLIRDYGPEYGMEVLDWIEEKNDNIVAIDIGGNEQRFPPKPFEPVFRRARDMGLHLVAHAGEVAGPESIWDAVMCLGVERIGHGIAARKDPRLMDYLRDKDITVEVCPVSNVLVGVVDALSEHPIREFHDRGMRVTVNSDDPAMFGTDMNNEYFQLHSQLGFTVPELFKLSLNAVDSSFLPEDRKDKLRETFIKDYQRLVDKA